MGTATSHVGDYMKLTPDQRALVKQVWIGVENNPQFHGSVFFMGFCEIYPQYIKYFTTEPRIPLTFDSRTNAKFTVIIETMGYLLLDFHNKPKQLDRIIGYVAMVHKDMNLERSDMFNFGVSLLEYLSVTFPAIMTPESLEVISKYMNNLLGELSQKIENFKKDDFLRKYETLGKSKTSCGEWLFCRESLIYGQTLDYWRERKNKWDERLNDWKLSDSTAIDPIRTSSTDEEEIALKSRTEDETSEFAESTARLLESHGIPRKTKIDLPPERRRSSLKAPEASSSRRSSTLRMRRSLYQPKTREDAVQEETDSFRETSAVPILTPRERRRSSRGSESKIEVAVIPPPNIQAINQAGSSGRSITSGERESSQARPVDSVKIDSPARQRRRRNQERIPRSHSPSIYF